MASRIKGITVEIGGDTTGLDTYLENGTLLYVPNTTDNRYARLQVIWYTSSKICAAYRYARINRGNNTVYFNSGTWVGADSVSDDTKYAIPSYILAALI